MEGHGESCEWLASAMQLFQKIIRYLEFSSMQSLLGHQNLVPRLRSGEMPVLSTQQIDLPLYISVSATYGRICQKSLSYSSFQGLQLIRCENRDLVQIERLKLLGLTQEDETKIAMFHHHIWTVANLRNR